MTKQELLLQTFKSKFDLSLYKKFIVEFFNDAKLQNGEKRQDRWNWNEYSFYISRLKSLKENIKTLSLIATPNIKK